MQLTDKELEVLVLVADGYQNSAIAHTLHIDVETVERHIVSAYRKLKDGNVPASERGPVLAEASI